MAARQACQSQPVSHAVPELRSASALRGFNKALGECNYDLKGWRNTKVMSLVALLAAASLLCASVLHTTQDAQLQSQSSSSLQFQLEKGLTVDTYSCRATGMTLTYLTERAGLLGTWHRSSSADATPSIEGDCLQRGLWRIDFSFLSCKAQPKRLNTHSSNEGCE